MDMDVAAARERVTEATSNWEARLAECHVEPYMTCKTDCRLTVTCVRAHSLTDADKQVLFDIFEDNMRATYEPTWGWDPAVKMKEMFSVNSLYIILQQGDDVVAYSHFQVCRIMQHFPKFYCLPVFQFCLDDDEEPECMVLYCFELQVKSSQQGKGLGGYIMNRLLNISRCWDMQKVVCHVLPFCWLESLYNYLVLCSDADSTKEESQLYSVL